jgi:hypothetical protein
VYYYLDLILVNFETSGLFAMDIEDRKGMLQVRTAVICMFFFSFLLFKGTGAKGVT